MTFTAKGSELTTHLKSLLEDPANMAALGLRRVYYGDQQYIPEVPAVCVEPAVITRRMIGVPLRTENEIGISVLIYCANVEGVEDAQNDADIVAEGVIDLINQDGLPAHHGGTNFGGKVIYGFVQTSEYGYIVKDNKLMRANRITVFAMNRTNLLEA
jgi:hypothetical protein